MEKFKVGDRVRVIEGERDSAHFIDNELCKVLSVNLGNYYLESLNRPKKSWFVMFNNVKCAAGEKEPKMKWEIKKRLTLGELLDNSKIEFGEVDRFWQYVKKTYSDLRGNILTDTLVTYAEKHDCFIEFLEEGGYVERVVGEVTYAITEMFRNKYGGYTAMLSQTDWNPSKVGLVILDGQYKGMTYATNVEIEDMKKITTEEFKGIVGVAGINGWEKIK